MKKPRVPGYRRHTSGQARVTLNGRDYLLGEYGSKESKQKYQRLVSEWLACDGASTFGVAPKQLKVAELILAYAKHCKAYYGTDPTSEYLRIKPALSAIKKLYGLEPVVSFGPLQYKAVREHLGREGDRSRKYVNRLCERIKRMFRWAVEESLVDVSIADAIGMVSPLKEGRTELKETDDVLPVAQETVDGTLPHLSRIVGDMVRFQLLTGCRPGEVCSLTPGMIDRTSDVWQVNLAKHKTAYRGKKRVIYVPKAAQEVLSRYLFRGPDDFCFSPKDSRKDYVKEKAAARVTPLSCGNKAGTNRQKKPKRVPGESYTTASYGRAIARGAEKAFPAPKEIEKDKQKVKGWNREHSWSPNQLRHTFATKIRKEYGLEVASVLLGHSELGVTQIYAEADREKAIDAVRRLG
jgi:integrase